MGRVAKRVCVSGRVQGVFFRAWTREQAERLDIAGWVRNADDGSVQAHVEGTDASVEKMIAAMRQGPAGARVEALDFETVAPIGSHSFKVKH